MGGSPETRNGWIVPISTDVAEFDIEFQWHITSRALWQVYRKEDWLVRHLIHIKLQKGLGVIYSMDSSCWPPEKCKCAPFRTTPTSVLRFDKDHNFIHRECRQIMTYGEQLKGEKADYFLEEKVDVIGIPMEQVWSWSINAFQKKSNKFLQASR